MDGLKYVIPMSCKQTIQQMPQGIIVNQLSIIPAEKPQKIKVECSCCQFNDPFSHTGKYVKIMDWAKGKPIKFVDLINDMK